MSLDLSKYESVDDPYILDVRTGIMAVYRKSRSGDTPGCHSYDERNVFFEMGEEVNKENPKSYKYISDAQANRGQAICDAFNKALLSDQLLAELREARALLEHLYAVCASDLPRCNNFSAFEDAKNYLTRKDA